MRWTFCDVGAETSLQFQLKNIKSQFQISLNVTSLKINFNITNAPELSIVEFKVAVSTSLDVLNGVDISYHGAPN